MGTYFQPVHIELLSHAVSMSEEIVSEYFSLTTEYWRKNPYEVKTLREERFLSLPHGVYAHLEKYGNNWDEKYYGADHRCLYRILVHDKRVLKTTGGRPPLIWPFFLYIMTHELIHMVRFAKFECAACIDDKEEEEKKVHVLTDNVLKRIKVPNIDVIIDFFNGKQVNLCMN